MGISSVVMEIMSRLGWGCEQVMMIMMMGMTMAIEMDNYGDGLVPCDVERHQGMDMLPFCVHYNRHTRDQHQL